jgi:Flp pilus assembly protein TadD
VSLLLDALRKAEEQKRKEVAEGTPDAEAGLALEPLASPADSAAPPQSPSPAAPALGTGNLPDLPSRLEDLDEQFLAHAAKPAPKPAQKPQAEPAAAQRPSQPPSPARAESVDAAREVARNLFETKQPATRSANRNFAIAAGLLGLAGAIGIGIYFWWQLQPKGGLGTPPPRVAAPEPAPIPVAPAVSPAPTFASAPEPEEEEVEEVPPSPPRRAEPPPSPAPPAQPETPIRLAATPPKPDPLPEQAWQAFNNGEFDLARTFWQKVLARDPRNPGALHGLAVLAQRDGQPGEAAEFYLRALEVDPKDALALAGLTSLRAPIDALRTESQLKTLLAEQPDSPYLNFALGNLYARESRWAEAQQVYFRAHAADAGNPDYLFNLAVSLDQLRQRRLAAQYYRQALDAAARRPAGFDAAGAASRLKILQADE